MSGKEKADSQDQGGCAAQPPLGAVVRHTKRGLLALQFGYKWARPALASVLGYCTYCQTNNTANLLESVGCCLPTCSCLNLAHNYVKRELSPMPIQGLVVVDSQTC